MWSVGHKLPSGYATVPPMLLLLLLAVSPAAASRPARELLDHEPESLPPLESLQGVWSGARHTGAYVAWDEDNQVFDGGCIRNSGRLIHAAFDKDSDLKIDYEDGKIRYDAEMQLFETFDGTSMKQKYTTPTDYSDTDSKEMIIAGIGPFLAGYTGSVDNFTRRAVVYSVGDEDEKKSDRTLGCLNWELKVDKEKKEVKLRQVEAFRVSIQGDSITMQSDICADGEMDDVQCVVDTKHYYTEDIHLDAPINGTKVDPFTYCVWSDAVLEEEHKRCLMDAMFPALQSAVDNAVIDGKLDKDDDVNTCFAWYESEHDFESDEYKMCFGKVQEFARNMLLTDEQAIDFCEMYVKCASCSFCSKYGWECLACNIDSNALGAAVQPTGVGSVDYLSGVTKADGVFQSSDLATGDTLPLEEWAKLVDDMYSLPTLQRISRKQGTHDIDDPVNQWPGFLQNINLSKDNKYTSVKDVFERLYGPRLTHTVGPYEQMVISATVVTEWTCTAGPCVGLVKNL